MVTLELFVKKEDAQTDHGKPFTAFPKRTAEYDHPVYLDVDDVGFRQFSEQDSGAYLILPGATIRRPIVEEE